MQNEELPTNQLKERKKMDTIKVQSGKTLMIAHRGLSGIELENTNAAFIAAGNRSHYGIETDVHKTSDGKFVVFHDDTTGRLSETDVHVEETSFEALRAIKLHTADGDDTRPELRIPTLKEYINTCKRYDKAAVLELKNKFTRDEIASICSEIDECGYFDKMIFISFCFENLVRLRELRPETTVQFLTDKYDDTLPQKLHESAFDLDILYTELNAENIRALHNAGVKINCWTCNDKDAADYLIKNGIDYITSNILE